MRRVNLILLPGLVAVVAAAAWGLDYWWWDDLVPVPRFLWGVAAHVHRLFPRRGGLQWIAVAGSALSAVLGAGAVLKGRKVGWLAVSLGVLACLTMLVFVGVAVRHVNVSGEQGWRRTETVRRESARPEGR